ncbi:uncharacterized protein METZ01_LOCUS130453, partial [marine metagenome]|tara:strand:- start:1537 stop:2199 length:663 start_codon:yes stop_codon:yes gene_type:complete
VLFIFSLTLVISLALYLFIVFSKSNLKRPALLVSFISLIFTFTLYFQSTGLERFKYIETYIYLENFFLDSEESRHLKRGKLFIKLKEYLETKKASKNELYLLKNRLNSINEFDLSALVLEELLNDPAGLPKALFSEYTQILFLLDNRTFTDRVRKALLRAFIEAPQDAVVLTLKGLEAFQLEDFDKAEKYWGDALSKIDKEEEKELIKKSLKTLYLKKNQ